MPVVDVDPDELRELTGHDEKSDEELKSDLFNLGLEFEGETDEGELQLEFAPDRLDRLSVEGVARSLRYQYGDDTGVYVPDTNDPDWTYEVEDTVPEGRPYVTGAVVRDVNMTEDVLESLIQLQEKLHATMGRKRAKAAIGIHDLTMLKGAGVADETNAITYRGIDPDGDRFVPLDADSDMTPAEVLAEHPIGPKYGDLLDGFDRYPAIYDDLGLFSFPPVINGRRTEVEADSRDLLIELTGTDQWTIDHICNIICYALSARGGTIEEVEIDYPTATGPYEAVGGALVRPDFETDTKHVTHDRIETILGVAFDQREVLDLFARAGLSASVVSGDAADDAATDIDDDLPASVADADGLVYAVEIPPYRVDVLHPIDLIDDLGRAYGFNELEPRYPDIGTVGGRHDRTRLEDATRASLIGLGFEDLLNFHMISAEANYDRLNIEPGATAGDADRRLVGAGEAVEITGPYSEDYTQLRTWVLPSLLMVLENNTHRAYPQDLAEIGLAAEVDESQNTNVAEWRSIGAVLARNDATYEDAKARLAALCDDFGVDLETPPTDHPTFIDGRAADVVIDGETVGVIGEVHPAVLVEHDLELPVAAFELRLDALE
ncbi:phenylalanine--tRNA ligase subunit beta [Halonotius terrestris]|uniref:Phenylalanine--tRNA ligase beta subunit n=1 Tax=Halonotius terrestris TaxID=2487750 RepID=A0A8J8TD07_9EURY|nr:phenylalanine--tRNA ligase subunit beta [Halonotius terrestris]TQQ83845.1 phenylalanine--tRNA ligase subunit beta [Halonotius terrestris]